MNYEECYIFKLFGLQETILSYINQKLFRKSKKFKLQKYFENLNMPRK